MSLLDSGRDIVTVYPEVETEDRDGNIITKPSDTGFTTRATLQPQASSGPSSGRDNDDGGFLTEETYRLRLPRTFPFVLGAQSAVEWNGEMWSLLGDGLRYNGSPNTAHVDYVIRRN